MSGLRKNQPRYHTWVQIIWKIIKNGLKRTSQQVFVSKSQFANSLLNSLSAQDPPHIFWQKLVFILVPVQILRLCDKIYRCFESAFCGTSKVLRLIFADFTIELLRNVTCTVSCKDKQTFSEINVVLYAPQGCLQPF